MLEILLYSTLSCTQSDAIMFRISANGHLDDKLKLELIETLKDSTPECNWDAND